MGLSSGDVIKYLLGGFSPLLWFGSGQQGAWYDPSDFTTLFQDSAGTTPVTAVEQPVGLMLDKSGRGNHAAQATAGNRPTLSARVNILSATETLSTQTVTTQATAYNFYFTGSGSVTLSGTATGTYSAGSNTITCTAGTLTVTVTGSVLTADLRQSNTGATLPVYQRVITSSNYDTAGFPLYISCNGTSSAMATSSIDFTAVNKMTIVTGVRKLADPAGAILMELSASSATNPGSFYISAPEDSATKRYCTTSRASAALTVGQASIVTGTGVSPDSAVITGTHDLPGAATVIRRNGSAFSAGTASKGTGNFGNYPLYLFSRAGTSLFFNGQFYGAIICGAAQSANQITLAENYINNKLGRIY